VSGASVSQWESGSTKDLKIATFFKVADALGMSPRELLTGKPGREELMSPDVRHLVESYLDTDEEYRAIILMVASASPLMRRQIAKSLVEAMSNVNRTPALPNIRDIQ
jgi:transcriptional regulator with XRE-family HTH domain